MNSTKAEKKAMVSSNTATNVALGVVVVACITRVLMGSRETLPSDVATKARFVRISRTVPILEIAEVQIYDKSNTNIAPLYGKVSMSSIKNNDAHTYGPGIVVNGSFSGNPMHGEVATTAVNDKEPVIEIDLGYGTDVQRIGLFLRDQDLHPNPSSEWIQKHLQNIRIQLLSERRQILWEQRIMVWQPRYEWDLQKRVPA